ncbi:MAG: iron-sulfur cluster assembly scaffold protein [Peptococcaceae bacterium]|nr:iron-sulfur cluster assembly scaffold protein [Peptococcaceae bacterium]
MYSAKVMEHFSNPRNAGKISRPDGEGIVGNIKCGDQLTIYIKVEGDRLSDVRFLVFGCAASIATSSMTTELVKGKTIAEAMAVTEQDVIDALDGLPPVKHHCSNLAVSALRLAIQDYEEKKTKSAVQRLQMSLLKSLTSLKDRIVTHMMYRLHGREDSEE